MVSLNMNRLLGGGYRSASQIARRVTEAWGSENLYCTACESSRVSPTPNNFQAVDFHCIACDAKYQLKASRRWDERRVPDAGYDAMMKALRSDIVPNLLVMQYSDDWVVRNLLLVPSFFFSPASVQKRKPLGPGARRAGWVGCNILLSKIAPIGKIRLVTNGIAASPMEVRTNYETVRPLASVQAGIRGWALDVLNIVHLLKKNEFELSDVYNHEDELVAIYPNNRNVRAKIRQQLQVLRDFGLLEFLGNGKYRVV